MEEESSKDFQSNIDIPDNVCASPSEKHASIPKLISAKGAMRISRGAEWETREEDSKKEIEDRSSRTRHLAVGAAASAIGHGAVEDESRRPSLTASRSLRIRMDGVVRNDSSCEEVKEEETRSTC